MTTDAMKPRIVVLGGGVSGEREVSLASSKAVFDALPGDCASLWLDLQEEALPMDLDPLTDLIFPVLHGGYGEDGRLQADLEGRGFSYVGCDSKTSRTCMQKPKTKQLVKAVGVPVAKEIHFPSASCPEWERLVEHIGTTSFVLKPAAEGSSVGLYSIENKASWDAVVDTIAEGEWLIEERFRGFDVTVGILDGEPLGIVGSHPEGGFYDYAHKYTPGRTRYSVPAQIPDKLTDEIRAAAKVAFSAVDGRDFARIDFMTDGERFIFLEVNTLPGMTETSLLPKSASIFGYNFATLVSSMLTPALNRSKHFKVSAHG